MKSKFLLTAMAAIALTTGAAHAQTTTPEGAPGSTPASVTPSTAADAKADAAVTASSSGAMASGTMSNGKVSHMTKKFIEDASAGNMFEIETSKVAVAKSTNQKVKDFAQKMIDDHTKAGDDMKAALTTPAEQADVSTKLGMMQQHKLDELNKDSASSFDKDYVNAQVDAHDKTIKLFSKYSDKGDDAALKTFATNTLPTLQQHKQMIDSIKSSMTK